MNLCLKFSTVIFWKIKSQSLNHSLPSSFDPDLVFIPINNVQMNPDYPDSLGLEKIVWIIEGPDNQKYEY